jgi:hypothetical protein
MLCGHGKNGNERPTDPCFCNWENRKEMKHCVCPKTPCQSILYYGCKKKHVYPLGNKMKSAGKAYVKIQRRNCGMLTCTKCIHKVTTVKARSIEKRIKRWKVNRMTIKHIILSPSQDVIEGMDYPEIKKKAYKLMKQCGVLGGVMIVHPFRCNDFRRYEKPGLHFHVVGYGNVRGTETAKITKEHRWIIKNKGKRKSVFVTLKYLLGHCGVSEKYKSIIWFGKLSYNKIKMERVMLLPCPYCKEPLERMAYVGSGIAPLYTDYDHRELLDEPSNWSNVKS